MPKAPWKAFFLYKSELQTIPCHYDLCAVSAVRMDLKGSA